MSPTSARVAVAIALFGAAFGAPASTLGQSLAEIAAKEKERREAAKAKPKAVKTYGDQDLAGYSGERPAEEKASGETPATSAVPKAKASAVPASAPEETAEARERREKAEREKDAEAVRARWREAQAREKEAEARLRLIEDEMKTLPPGLPAGNYRDDILAAVEQQKAERERRHAQAKSALAAASEAKDAVETEARRKQIRLD